MGVSALELRRRVLMAQPHKERKTGGIVSFDTHVPQVLDVSVPLSPVQSGTGDPSPSNVRPISGWQGLTAWRTGVNLLDVSTAEDGAIYNKRGTKIASVSPARSNVIVSVKPNTKYYLVAPRYKNVYNFVFFDSTMTGLNVAGQTPSGGSGVEFTTSANCHYVAINMETADKGIISLNYPSTDTAYHPYTGASYPVTFPETVYFGTLDAVNGVLTATYGIADLGSLTWGSDPNRLTVKYTRSLSGSIFKKSPWADAICSEYALNKKGPDAIRSGQFSTTNAYGAGYVLFKDDAFSGMTVGEVKEYLSGVQLVYELAEPLIIPLTPAEIRALMGENNVFADAGDVEVEFWTN